jgi:hypothetical protein
VLVFESPVCVKERVLIDPFSVAVMALPAPSCPTPRLVPMVPEVIVKPIELAAGASANAKVEVPSKATNAVARDLTLIMI